ncbi:MAG: tetratricopeptide repeat-containing serine/threonine-protein kinase, partial [Longimicrobiales bacterium]|nr:tetratricopeptide repeat-containing serine/threonine-protein kinase [Longimicrobiales bacterium]
RRVALKVLHPELAATVGHERFLREIEIVAGLTHPHILTLIDSGEADGLLFFVMPYVEGETLQARLNREGQLPVEEALRIGREVADALAYAHENGVIHRDIKPSNILLEAGHAVISDFGVARAVGAAGVNDATATGIAVGTPKYMSPEQATGGEVDGRADVYALGCVLWEMLAGDAPFDGPTPQALLVNKLSDTTPSLRARRRSVSPEVEGVIERAMALLPADRFGTARELEQALTDPEMAKKVRPRRRRQARTRRLAGFAFAALIGVVGWWMFGRGTPLEAASPYALAVLPPENLTGEEEYFVAGQHQALIDHLAAITGFRVISRPSVMRYQDTEMTVPEIATELGVKGIVASSLARRGDTVDIRVQLVQAEPEEALLWTGSFDEVISGLYTMYGEAARSIAARAEVRLSPAEEARLGGNRTIDPATYEAYLRGMHLLHKRTPEDVAQGLVYLHDATDRNPAEAMAWAGLSLGYSTVGHGPFPTPDVWTRARAAADRAVRLDPDLAEAWSALADVRFYADWDWEGAEAAFRRANELNSSIAMNHFHYAWLLLVLDRYEEAVEEHELAKELDPFTPFQSALLGWCYLYGGDTERAKEEARRTLELNPDAMFGLFVLGAAQQIEGRYEEAIATHERMGELYPVLQWLTGVTYARAGRAEEARRIAAEMEARELIAMEAFGLSVLYGALGDVDSTYRWLTHEPNHAWRPAVWIDPIVGIPSEVLADPRFEPFLERLNLPWTRE